ncbi:hypothetical protein B0J18DRAFT_459379 [Chaetomium sp. MPI-SDFR-AT-0129]|nr:hypothetical protein B0J18DRAFT_459379 [Chaetomium sp. MPI-SDFR-AT-0129]
MVLILDRVNPQIQKVIDIANKQSEIQSISNNFSPRSIYQEISTTQSTEPNYNALATSHSNIPIHPYTTHPRLAFQNSTAKEASNYGGSASLSPLGSHERHEAFGITPSSKQGARGRRSSIRLAFSFLDNHPSLPRKLVLLLERVSSTPNGAGSRPDLVSRPPFDVLPSLHGLSVRIAVSYDVDGLAFQREQRQSNGRSLHPLATEYNAPRTWLFGQATREWKAPGGWVGLPGELCLGPDLPYSCLPAAPRPSYLINVGASAGEISALKSKFPGLRDNLTYQKGQPSNNTTRGTKMPKVWLKQPSTPTTIIMPNNKMANRQPKCNDVTPKVAGERLRGTPTTGRPGLKHLRGSDRRLQSSGQASAAAQWHPSLQSNDQGSAGLQREDAKGC